MFMKKADVSSQINSAMTAASHYVLDHLGELMLVLDSPKTHTHEDKNEAAIITTVPCIDRSQGVMEQRIEKRNRKKEQKEQERALWTMSDLGSLFADPNSSNSQQTDDFYGSYRYRVSRRHLCLASPVFRAMLEGPWMEATRNGQTTDISEIRASEWDPEALLIILRLIHGLHKDVPRKVCVDTLCNIAAIVDYYQCHDVVEIFAERWLPAARETLSNKSSIGTFKKCLFTSVVFKDHKMFKDVAPRIIWGCTGPVNTSLPVPHQLLGM